MLIIQFDKLSLCLILFLLLHPPLAAAAASAPEIQAASAVVMASDGQTLFEKDADRQMLIASTTKIMTALICVEHASLDETVTPQAAHCAVEGSSMYLKPGEAYTVRELLTGLLLASGNDAALTLADHVGGSEKAFVRLMNQKAQMLGLSNTHFSNPHGLDAGGHHSTARDLARLMLACMENPDFRELTRTVSAEIHGQYFLNHNRLLSDCPGCIGGKTGYTRAAGRCLVSCCEREGMRLVCVTLSDPDDWKDHRKLYDRAYADYRMLDLSEHCCFEVPVVSGSKRVLRAMPEEGQSLIVPRNQSVSLRAELPRFVFAPIKKGDTAGSVSVIIQGKPVADYPLYFADNAAMAYPVDNILLQEDSPSWQREFKSLYRRRG